MLAPLRGGIAQSRELLQRRRYFPAIRQDEMRGSRIDCHIDCVRINSMQLAPQAPNSFCSSPDWYISPMMSEPPTNSPLT